MSAGEEEEIFQINDYTTVTEFEVLTNNVELFLRNSGLSVDIRQAPLTLPLATFQFRDFSFSIERRGIPKSEATAVEPVCLSDMWSDSPDFYPFPNYRLTELFGLQQCLVLKSLDIPDCEKNAILSAVAVAAQNCKCALPVFIQRDAKQGLASLVVQGVLLFPGIYATFEVFDLEAAWQCEPGLKFVSDFPALLSFFTAKVARSNGKLQTTMYAEYEKVREKLQFCESYDVIKAISVQCRWASSPSASMKQSICDGQFDTRKCSSFRVCYQIGRDFASASDYFLQLKSTQRPLFQMIVSVMPLQENLLEAAYFDEFLLTLADLFPVFPINSLWTKIATEKLLKVDNFTVYSVRSIIEHVRRIAETGSIQVDVCAEFKQYAHCSDLHKHTVIILAAMHCARMHRQIHSGDTNSRLVFLHLSPVHEREQRVLHAEAVDMYRKGMVFRVLKAYYVDKFMQNGTVPTVSELILWHKSAKIEYPHYASLCAKIDDGDLIAFWTNIAARPFAQVLESVISELLKEMELSMQFLEYIRIEEMSRYIPGLCISSILSIVFRRQVEFLIRSNPDCLALAGVRQLLTPVFRDFSLACRHTHSFTSMDSAAVDAVRSHLETLELNISLAFALTALFPQSQGLTAALAQSRELNALEGTPAYIEVRNFVMKLDETDTLRQRQTVIRTESERLACTIVGEKANLAVARVRRERGETNKL